MTKKPDPAGLKLRLIAAERLRAVLGGEHFAPISSSELHDGRDRALANRLVTTALRRHGQINAMIFELLDKGMPGKSGTFEAVLRLSLAQLVFLPDIGAHSALFLAVEAVKRDPKARHLSGLINAMLRRAQSNSARYGMMDDSLLLPTALRDKWEAAYGAEEVSGFADGLINGAPLDLTLRDEDQAMIDTLGAEKLTGDSVRVETRDRPVDALPFYDEGRWWVQDVSSAIPASLLKAKAGGTVLDLCAAPGGKTAQLVKAGYTVTALDSDGTRLERLNTNMARLGYSPVVVEADATSYLSEVPFDGILIDAPCSATGTFRRHPDVLHRVRPSIIAETAALQARIFARAADWVKPGGTLVYATCSLEPSEGEAQLDAFLTARSDYTIVPVEQSELPAGITPTEAGTIRTLPGMLADQGGCDGFFIARLKRS